jgi:hypothetical protein
MKSLKMAARGCGVQTKSQSVSRRKSRPIRGIVSSGTRAMRKTGKTIWHNWLMEENYL